MKSLRLLLCALPLALTGCSTLSSVNWSAAYPWNWFGSSAGVTEQGVGGLNGSTALNEQAISDALGSSYRLRSGMKAHDGNIVHYFEALRGDKLALVINGDSGTVSRIDVLDDSIEATDDVKVGTPFNKIYDKAFGNCQATTGDDSNVVECKAKGSEHISYQFSGDWQGPQGLMPPDDTLKNWTLKKIIWRR
ncbi:RpoE-regulated lipoprotein [Kluyvera ascorbata]|uniref:RpoE-regulated lipoprotein n=1 Tax=Kluyvera ascorbata TaxID=51288 RepID=UPI0029406EDE|nr:RpoE-regulated lipoprotein [Kluyvera ascorbata]MDZ4032477.1 RpoE-regulated lipoprotein [Kluyvera ascorbata]HDG1694230.1 RpoE-regulated lipoprotein [Kluyvera ascorbata]HDG1698424.1 RpoE-regulated lipoprotein [Kluyvera ascorbata]HED1310181.1 RpoE-regulated lipoprotein [Kluyvera ascorbata]